MFVLTVMKPRAWGLMEMAWTWMAMTRWGQAPGSTSGDGLPDSGGWPEPIAGHGPCDGMTWRAYNFK